MSLLLALFSWRESTLPAVGVSPSMMRAKLDRDKRHREDDEIAVIMMTALYLNVMRKQLEHNEPK